MPSLVLSVNFPELDVQRYLRDLRQSIRQAVILASQKFLEVAIPLIPVWTGMASGALENLEIFAGTTIPRSTPRAPRIQGYYYYPTRELRTPQLGQSLATQPNEMLSGDLVTAETGTRLHFQFKVDINYFDILDAEEWGAFAAGTQAFNLELREQLERLRPEVGDYFVRRRWV